MLLGYLDTIPRELDEAATIDGCSTLRVITSVILPVAWPGVVATAIYSFAQAWNEYLIALTLVTRNELKTIPVGLAGFFGEYTTRWDLVMTASVIATIPSLIIFLILQRQLVSGLAAGAVKE
jgi:ABC-type glycerol-3-phosphate transport system permease component